MSKLVDFRSDAATLPTAAMRQAMAGAAVGNDDFGEDPTITRLETTIAELLGKEAAVFVHSGTMANLAALMSHVEPGDLVLTGKDFHVYDYEGTAQQRVAGCRFETLDEIVESSHTRLVYEGLSPGGRARAEQPRLLCLENTVSRLGGTLIACAHLAELAAFAREHGMAVHLDGARLFNAAIALNVAVGELARHADTVSVALTKAVGAPAGAVVAASGDVAERLRRNRWMLGGNWKQGGVFAAACLHGLETVDEVVRNDHANARRLAESLHALEGCHVDLDRVVSNIVFLELTNPTIDPQRLQKSLLSQDFAFGRWKPGRFPGGSRCRLVTHRDISREDVERFAEAFGEEFRAQQSEFAGRFANR